MKVSMRLTLDGLVRAMRARGHELAEEVESGARREAERPFDLRREALKRADSGRRGGLDERRDA